MFTPYSRAGQVGHCFPLRFGTHWWQMFPPSGLSFRWCSHSSQPYHSPHSELRLLRVTFFSSPNWKGRAVMPSKGNRGSEQECEHSHQHILHPCGRQAELAGTGGCGHIQQWGCFPLQKPPPSTALPWDSWLDLFPPERILQLLVTASTTSDYHKA